MEAHREVSRERDRKRNGGNTDVERQVERKEKKWRHIER